MKRFFLLLTAVILLMPQCASGASVSLNSVLPDAAASVHNMLNVKNMLYMKTAVKTWEEASALDYYNPSLLTRYTAYVGKNPDMEIHTVVALVNVNVDLEHYSSIKIVDNPDDLLVLLNKNYALPPDYVPTLETVDGMLLDTRAAEAYRQMKLDAQNAGYTLTMGNTYRSLANQTANYWGKVKTRGQADVDKTNARPGHTEHHTGLAIDFAGFDYFDRRTEYQWVTENAYKYGFILRYPEGAEHITGYSYESWHYRYVGAEAAKEIYESGITFEEYIGRSFINS